MGPSGAKAVPQGRAHAHRSITDGFVRFCGWESDQQVGTALTGLGDHDGDGYEDFLVGTDDVSAEIDNFALLVFGSL